MFFWTRLVSMDGKDLQMNDEQSKWTSYGAALS
jgi:hypothetical protein